MGYWKNALGWCNVLSDGKLMRTYCSSYIRFVQISAVAIASGIPWTASIEENSTVEKRTLQEAITDTDQASSNSRWTISDKLKSTILAIPFTQRRTLRIADDAFLSEMVPLINVKYVNLGNATGTTKDFVVGHTALVSLVGGLCARIDEMTMFNTRQFEGLSKRIDGLAKKMEDLTGRLGHLSEETIRRKLAESKGIAWCQVLRVTSMNEIMERVEQLQKRLMVRGGEKICLNRLKRKSDIS